MGYIYIMLYNFCNGHDRILNHEKMREQLGFHGDSMGLNGA